MLKILLASRQTVVSVAILISLLLGIRRMLLAGETTMTGVEVLPKGKNLSIAGSVVSEKRERGGRRKKFQMNSAEEKEVPKKLNDFALNVIKFQMNSAEEKEVPKKLNDFALNVLKLNLLQELSSQPFNEMMQTVIDGLPLVSNPQPKPAEIILASTWRSGSTFLQHLIAAHRGVFTSYEPLLFTKYTEFYDADAPDVTDIQKLLKDILMCRYEDSYLKTIKKGPKEEISRNDRIWEVCKANSPKRSHDLCFQKNFLEAACPLFPWKLMKLVRLGVKLLQPILEDRSLNPYVLYLVRDPRAVMNSRSSVKWCHDDCADPAILCRNMEDNLRHVKTFSKLFPGRVHLVRYEDLCTSPLNAARKLMKDIHFNVDVSMEDFINKHTTSDSNQPWTITRESSKRVTFWTTQIDAEMLNRVQTVCADVMSRLGYLHVNHTDNLSIKHVFDPIKNPLQ